LALDVLVGAAPAPGLAIGGALLNDFLVSADFERDDVELGDHSARATVLGVFADGFPDPRGGWRLGGTIGLAQIHVNSLLPGGDSLDEWGLGFAGWAGYTPWVSDEFAIGVTLRAMATLNTGGDTTATTRSLNLMWSALYF
jgi:hypothetical protein